MNLKDLQQLETATMNTLKDFQIATVERVDELFRNGQKRVLVADEVGLGKTMIARGVISKTSIMQFESGEKLFKVAYICSNQVIAKQNVRKLDIFDLRSEGDNGDSRLSMQHFKIALQDSKAKDSKQFAQLIPLSPSTSFNTKTGQGVYYERALIFAILKRIPALDYYIGYIGELLKNDVWGWDTTVDYYDKKIHELEGKDIGYPQNVIEKVYEYNNTKHILESLIQYSKETENNEKHVESGRSLINRLRIMFAEISVEMLRPDLVIMDEFQRFRDLINLDLDNTESGMLVKKFFQDKNLKVLLLSATPYKLYSTIEEIEETEDQEEYYKEFIKVIEFLANDNQKLRDFKDLWSNYSIKLRETIKGDTAILSLKSKAEDEMYRYMCRTERISVMDKGDYIDDHSVRESLKITKGDIHSYMDMGKLYESINDSKGILVDFAKSSPYLLSFMNNKYKAKDRIEKYFKENTGELKKAKSKYLWIDRDTMENYSILLSNNARLEELKRQIFYNDSELYLWVPPSKPYFPLEGVYKNSKGFSKILVFSSWSMVPKMIGSLISYEEEINTVGIVSDEADIKSGNNTYFAESGNRYPGPRLRFNVSEGKAQGMYLFCLYYPSEALSELYNPIDFMNRDYSLNDIREELKDRLRNKVKQITDRYAIDSERTDRRWYYAMPLILDLNDMEYVEQWFESERYGNFYDTSLQTHLEYFKEFLNPESVGLGKPPADLLDVLADIAIGSFAVCIYRSYDKTDENAAVLASELAKVFIDRFNSCESTAAVMLAYPPDKDPTNDGHWRDVLRYCCDGGFGAMFDEYMHMISEDVGFDSSKNRTKTIHETMMSALKIRSASYKIDTYPSFCKRMKSKNSNAVFMRTHYAVSFTKSDNDDKESNINRKESLRMAFNSPMRPFVLATTSIGQEGLDFHYYCRKIMHWNLPSNPIDLEQREGRINRYKCLAIRQDLAERFSDRKFSKDVWQELFAMAANEIRKPGQSDLVPFWCLGEGQSVKIERIVPMFPISKDETNYQRLIKVLSLYRISMGQTRQEELVNYFLENYSKDTDFINSLFINLSPYKRKDASWKEQMSLRKPVIKEKKKTKRQERIELLRSKLALLELEKSRLDKEIETIKNYNLIGMHVTSESFGRGTIISKKNDIILVRFEDCEKKMINPKAFFEGHLKSEYSDYIDNENKKLTIPDQLEKCNREISKLEEELGRYVV